MAVNINVGTHSHESNPNENFEEVADQNAQQDPSSQSQLSQQSGNHADNLPAPEPIAPPPEETPPPPAFARYGIGDTVVMGVPDYVRAYADRAEPSAGEPSLRETAFAPAPRAENAPPPSATKPIAMPKPGANMSPTPASSPPTASPTATTNAPTIGGESMASDSSSDSAAFPTNRETYLYPGLHTQPEQSPYYANALLYGREHGYNDDEVMKLAVLMQSNRDQNMGREWLALKPEVLRAAVNAVVRNPDNSFDTSGVFGGVQGYPGQSLPQQRVYIDESGQGYLLDYEGNRIAAPIPTTPPPGWVLEIIPAAGTYSDNATHEQRYFRPSDETQAESDFPYLPLMMTGRTQVPRGVESELSVGADGGVHDLSRLEFDPLYGLITTPDNIRPIQPAEDEVGDALSIVLTVAVTAMLTYGVGAAVGIPAITATTTVGGAIVIGAANGAIGGLVSGVINDNLSFKGVFQSALAGGLFAGVSQLGPVRDLNSLGLDPKDPNIVTSYALRALSITGQATLRGALQEIVGGKFKDGFTQGIAQGLATEIGRAINSDIAARLERGNITAEEAVSLRQLSGYTTAAIRALGNPGDPLHAFAQEFIGQLVGDVTGGTTVPEVRGTVFDDDGNLTPGFVDPNASIAVQQQQLRAALTRQGIDASTIESMVDFQTERWENADYASNANTALNRSIDANAPMDVQTRQLRLILAAEGFDAAKIDDRVNLYVQQRQTSTDIDSFEATLNAPLNGQLASADPRSAAFILDNSLLTLSQKADQIERNLSYIEGRIREFSANANAAAARGDQASVDAWNGQAGECRRYQTEHIASRSVVGIAREAQGAAESLYSNTAGYSRQQIDEAMMRLISQRRQTGGVDEWMSQQLLRNNPITYATLVDPDNTTALAQAVGQLGVGLGSIRSITRAGGRLPPPETTPPNGGSNNNAPPRIRSTRDVIGTSEGANGVWIREPIPLKGADYQEQITGVERGSAYYVKGTKFDGIYPAEKVLVDAKDWTGYAPVGSNGQLQSWFVKGTLDQAERQLRSAAGSGYSVRWTVPDEASAARLREVFRSSTEVINIQIVVVPKK